MSWRITEGELAGESQGDADDLPWRFEVRELGTDNVLAAGLMDTACLRASRHHDDSMTGIVLCVRARFGAGDIYVPDTDLRGARHSFRLCGWNHIPLVIPHDRIYGTLSLTAPDIQA